MEVIFPKINNKLAIFDFDYTLVGHSYSKEYYRDRVGSYLMECVYMLTALKEEHANDRPLPCMQWYVKKLFEEGYGLYCLTHEPFNLRNRLKEEQLAAFYPGMPMMFLAVDTPEHKIDMMKAVSMVECCDPSDIIFVDDMMNTVNMARAEGFDAKHISDIVLMYESRKEVQQADMMLSPAKTISTLTAKTLVTDKPVPKYKPVDGAETPEEGFPHLEVERICREYRETHKNAGL